MEEVFLSCNEFLLQLYRNAETCAPGDFQSETLKALSRVLPADSAAWGGGYAAQRNITDLIVWNNDSSLLTDWHQVRDVDPLCDFNLRHMGEAHHIDEIPDYRQSLAFNEHWRQRDIHQLMAAIVNEPQSNYVSFIALCHTDPRRPFTEHERRLKQTLLPHLAQAQRQNQRIYLQRLANPTQAVALVTAGGLVRSCQPAFSEVARDRWGQSSRLPETIMSALRRDGHWVSRDLDVSGQALGSGYLVRLEEGRPLVELSPREREVAELYARGMNYKAIAQHLDRSPATVRNLLSRCYQKLDVHDKVSLIRRMNAID